MPVHGIQHRLRYLRTGGIVEEHERPGALQRRKLDAQRIGRELIAPGCGTCRAASG